MQSFNYFFIVFKVYIDFKSWAQSILIHWSKTREIEREKEVGYFLSQQVSISSKKKTSHLDPLAFQSCHHFFWILSCQVWPLGMIYESCRVGFVSEVLHEDHLFEYHPFGQSLLDRSSFWCARDPSDGLIFFWWHRHVLLMLSWSF